MIIPFVDLKAQYFSIKEEIDGAIQNVIKDTAFVGGDYLKIFEQDFAAFVGAKHCIGVGNGTDAIYIALKCLGIKEGHEVITVANSFIATSESITQTGARVVFVDCNKDTYNIDVSQIEKRITHKTKAIIPVHLYGQPVAMDEILKIAKKHNLFVMEDAAQAHGAKYKGTNAGTLGDCATFSFFPGKNLGAYGDGGAIVTNNDDLAKKIRMFSNHGRIEKYNHEFEGINSRLDGLQAAILSVKLKHLGAWTERRIAIAAEYTERLKNVVITPTISPEARHVYHLYVIRTKNRDKVSEFLKKKGISTGIHYPIALPFLEAYRYLQHKPSDFPVAHQLPNEILSLPIYAELSHEQVTYITEQLRIACQSK